MSDDKDLKLSPQNQILLSYIKKLLIKTLRIKYCKLLHLNSGRMKLTQKSSSRH